ncbi:MAG: hypothetical protein Tsb008_12010 [Rhodothalassiaceae bacterium]
MARVRSAGKTPPLLPERAVRALSLFAIRTLGLSLLALAVALSIALLSYDPSDPSFNHSGQPADGRIANLLGAPGAHIADLMLQTLGYGAYALVLPLLGWGWRIASRRGLPWIATHLLALPPFLLAAALAFAPLGDDGAVSPSGGMIGSLLYRELSGLLLAFGLPTPPLAVGIGAGLAALVLLPAVAGLERREWRAFFGLLRRALHLLVLPILLILRRGEESEPDNTARPARRRRAARRRKDIASERVEPKIADRARTAEGKRVARERQGSLFPEQGGFTLPPLDLLNPAPAGTEAAIGREALEQNARLLESVLEEYGVKGTIVSVRPGPVVTLYELEPAPGTKSARVIGLSEDIARSMSAVSARIAVIPGRNAIGIELPNSRREQVALREILASRLYETTTARLPLTLGKDIGGAPVIADLSAMPHLLVAGTTGSGKSVGLNAMILSLLYRLPPRSCRLIMIDPKMLELSIYDGIPHLLTPVVTEAKKAVVALKWAVREMESRYRAMSLLGVRNLAAYNKRVEEAKAKGETLKWRAQTGFDRETGQPIYEEQELEAEILPMIVIVIDEMADLMLVAGKDVEAVVQRLAQMARAAGIHLIMATQRPSVDVITGTIKANFPTRISFQVTSKIDSRTILGEQGAEQLLGMGDMLFMAGGGRITRVHGAFVSDGEVEKVVKHLKSQGMPDYMEEVTEEPEEGFDMPFLPGASSSSAEDDASLYDRAVDIVQRERRVSTSYIQRRLRIGYNRAASLIEDMERNGVISAPNHAGKREILTPDRSME